MALCESLRPLGNGINIRLQFLKLKKHETTHRYDAYSVSETICFAFQTNHNCNLFVIVILCFAVIGNEM